MPAYRPKATLGALTLSTAIALSIQETHAFQGQLLEEVVVTATKREESQQDVPIAIAAFTGDALKELGMGHSNDMAQFVPGLEMGTTAGEGSSLSVFLRGAGLNDFNTNNAGPIGMYADEVYISSPALTAFQFFDLERVEVLKGPQGTLYGRNTTGGAIKFISKKPTEEFSGDVRMAYANHGRTELDAAISGALSDSVRGRVALSKVDSDGWQENLANGSDENGVDTLSWRGILDWDISDSSSLRVNVHGSDVDQSAQKYHHFGIGPGGTDALGYSGPKNLHDGRYNRDGVLKTDSSGGYIEFQTEIGDLQFTSVTAYDEVENLVEEETDSSPNDLINVDSYVESDTFSQELRLEGSTEKLEWLLGAFYLTENLSQEMTVDLFRSLRPFVGGGSDPTGAVNPFGAPILFARLNNHQTAESWAVFGQADYALTEQLTLTLGLRYTDESREFDAATAFEDPITFGPNPFPVYDFEGLKMDDDAVSWRVGVDYFLNNDAMVYASVSSGFKSGGFNGGFLSLDPAEAAIQAQPYESEFLTAYELGLKSEWLDGRLRFNMALFFNDFEDLQVFTLINTATLPIQVLDNASEAEVYGLEFDATWYPTESLLFNLTGALMDTELKNFQGNGAIDYSGNEVARSPETSVTLLSRYDHQLDSEGSVFVQGSVAYKSDQFFDTENSDLMQQEGYSVVNARIGYRHASDQWGIALYANNLLDKEYNNNAINLSDFGFINYYPAAPRSFGIELNLNF